METPPMFLPGTTTLMESEKCVILTMKFKSRTLWCGTHTYALLNLCYVSECDIVGLILALSSGWAYACHLFLRKNCWAWSSRKCPFLKKHRAPFTEGDGLRSVYPASQTFLKATPWLSEMLILLCFVLHCGYTIIMLWHVFGLLRFLHYIYKHWIYPVIYFQSASQRTNFFYCIKYTYK